MGTTTLEADYLVVGAGAMGMAFTDALASETDATVVLVDRHHQPGGHWNDAYPFVRLHQPSSFYGVNSRALGSDTIDQTGWNQGLYELASGAEVCAYFDQVMQQQFLPSGRVQYFPMCESRGDDHFESLVSDARYRVRVRRKRVDATYMKVEVPSVRAPGYAVAPGVRCVPLNALAQVTERQERYVVIGAGKTGMDACLWLLRNGVAPGAIVWIMPRDSWLLDRAKIQPGELRQSAVRGFTDQTEAIAAAASIDDLFARLEACGQLLRLDRSVRPTMYRCATVTRAELEQLRRIQNVVRLGRVKRLERDAIVLDQGSLPTSAATLHVDCSADGLARRPALPVFQGDRITLQAVRTCQQVFSAAFIGHVEAAYSDEPQKNALCTVVPHPDSELDWLRTTLATTLNQGRWAQDPALQKWLRDARLDGFSGLGRLAEDPERGPRLAQQLLAGVARLQQLLAEADAG